MDSPEVIKRAEELLGKAISRSNKARDNRPEVDAAIEAAKTGDVTQLSEATCLRAPRALYEGMDGVLAAANAARIGGTVFLNRGMLFRALSQALLATGEAETFLRHAGEGRVGWEDEEELIQAFTEVLAIGISAYQTLRAASHSRPIGTKDSAEK